MGPLAASTTPWVVSDSATPASMAPESAAGTTSSHATLHNRDGSSGSPPSKPATLPVALTWSDRAEGSRPPALRTAPPTSLTATTRIPADASRNASGPPTLPNPWMTARLPAKGIWRAPKAARAHMSTPDEVAPAWARVPPTARGLPVTVPPRAWPLIMARVSMSHAMTRPSVFTSGAGTSLSEPSSGEISTV